MVCVGLTGRQCVCGRKLGCFVIFPVEISNPFFDRRENRPHRADGNDISNFDKPDVISFQSLIMKHYISIKHYPIIFHKHTSTIYSIQNTRRKLIKCHRALHEIPI